LEMMRNMQSLLALSHTGNFQRTSLQNTASTKKLLLWVLVFLFLMKFFLLVFFKQIWHRFYGFRDKRGFNYQHPK
jgi:hypothetical protein